MNYQEAKKSLVDNIAARMSCDIASIDKTASAMAELEEIFKISEIFGFVPESPSIGPSYIAVDFRNLESCAQILPLLELLDSRGWVATGSSDYPEAKNRDFQLTKNYIRFRLGAYFTSHNCRKVAVRTAVEYRMECGVESTDQTAQPETPPSVVEDDMPF